MNRSGRSTVRGHVLEPGGERPVLLARVALVDTSFAVVAETFTDHEGAFELTAPGVGDYFIAAERLGYYPLLDGVLELGEGGFLPVDFYLRPRPVELAPLVATVDREMVRRHLESQGFYEREQSGFGHFITPAELERRLPMTGRDLLRAAPGVSFEGGPFGAGVVWFRRRGTPLSAERGGESQDTIKWPVGMCRPHVYVDGVEFDPGPVRRDTGQGGVVIEDIVPLTDIAAVEVHTRATSVPLQYGGTTDCGALLIWTIGG